MDFLILVPVILLVLVAALRFDKGRLSVTLAVSVWLVMLTVWLILRNFVPDTFLYREAEATRKVNWLTRHLLRDSGDWQQKPVIVILGSSATQYGIDPEILQTSLDDRGHEFTVLQFSMAGANHYERLAMLELFERELGKHRRAWRNLPKQVWSEVFDAYDTNPLYLFEREAYTERAIQMMSPSIAWRAWEAYREFYPKDPHARGLGLGWVVFEHVMLNRFAVGVFSDGFLPEKRTLRTPPFFGLDGAKTDFDFEKTVNTFAAASRGAIRPGVPPPAWFVHEKHLHRFFGNALKERGFLALPVIEPVRWNYQASFAQNRPAESFMLGPFEPDSFSFLLQGDSWFDGVHLTGEAAKEFTRTLQLPSSSNLQGTSP
jgi:hypothetical protein